ncbi:MAG: hypothetical protein QM726_19390 [Chitinophagaceae bacterium]
MRHFALLLAATIFLNLTIKSQNLIAQPLAGIWTEKQNSNVSIQWLFKKNEFARVSCLANSEDIGCGLRTGNFNLDALTNTIKFKFNTTFGFNEVSNYKNNAETQEWKIVSMKKDEIVISRNKIGEEEKTQQDGRVYITLIKLVKPLDGSTLLK